VDDFYFVYYDLFGWTPIILDSLWSAEIQTQTKVFLTVSLF